MKLISTLLLLLGSAVAQVQPFAFSQVSADTWQGKNVAPKEILAYVIEFESPHVTVLSHDCYFKPDGIASGAIEVFDDAKASEPGHVLWVQFVDGTEWGDHRIGLSNLLLHRQPTLPVGIRNGQRLLPWREKGILGLSGVQQRSGWLRQTRLDHAKTDRNRRCTRPLENPAGLSREARQDVGGEVNKLGCWAGESWPKRLIERAAADHDSLTSASSGDDLLLLLAHYSATPVGPGRNR